MRTWKTTRSGQCESGVNSAAAVAEAPTPKGGGWFYTWIELEVLRLIHSTSQLPWRKLKDKEEIGLLKIHFNSPELVHT